MANTRFLGVVLLVLLVSLMRAEASVCETKSEFFKGLCFRNDNCATICEKEGYLTGRCKGFLLKCVCAKDCGGPNNGATTGGGNPPANSGDNSGSGGAPPADGSDNSGGAPPADGSDNSGGAPPDSPSDDPLTSDLTDVEI